MICDVCSAPYHAPDGEPQCPDCRGNGPALDLELLRKIASGEGGRRTGALMRAGYLECRVTDAGRRVIGLVDSGDRVRHLEAALAELESWRDALVVTRENATRALARAEAERTHALLETNARGVTIAMLAAERDALKARAERLEAALWLIVDEADGPVDACEIAEEALNADALDSPPAGAPVIGHDSGQSPEVAAKPTSRETDRWVCSHLDAVERESRMAKLEALVPAANELLNHTDFREGSAGEKAELALADALDALDGEGQP